MNIIYVLTSTELLSLELDDGMVLPKVAPPHLLLARALHASRGPTG